VKLHVPRVLKFDEKTERNDPVQQIGVNSRWIDGTLASFTRDKLKGWLFQPQAGAPEILLVPTKSKNVPDTFAHVISCDGVTNSDEVDVSKGMWLRFPAAMEAANETPDERVRSVLSSWLNAFSYIQEDPSRNVLGLRAPQIGALHALHAHWSVTDSIATIVMPTGTGKTETMLSILTSARRLEFFSVAVTSLHKRRDICVPRPYADALYAAMERKYRAIPRQKPNSQHFIRRSERQTSLKHSVDFTPNAESELRNGLCLSRKYNLKLSGTADKIPTDDGTWSASSWLVHLVTFH